MKSRILSFSFLSKSKSWQFCGVSTTKKNWEEGVNMVGLRVQVSHESVATDQVQLPHL